MTGQIGLRNHALVGGRKEGQDGVIFSQDTVDVADHIVRLAKLAGVVGTPALVVAEFLVGPAAKNIATFQTKSLFFHA